MEVVPIVISVTAYDRKPLNDWAAQNVNDKYRKLSELGKGAYG
jgi:hypothetical protein